MPGIAWAPFGTRARTMLPLDRDLARAVDRANDRGRVVRPRVGVVELDA